MAKMHLGSIGRKRDSAVWNYFSFDSESNKSKCLVAEKELENSPICGRLIGSRKPTNLKMHLERHHV
jgi:hypothetical protein